MTRRSITYVLPGGLRATYAGEAKPYWRWLWGTAGGGLALWRIWLRVAWQMARNGHMPWPDVVTAATVRLLRRLLKAQAP